MATSSVRSLDHAAYTRLRGARLAFARALWAILALANLIPFLLSTPLYYQRLSQFCAGPHCVFEQVNPSMAETMAVQGLSLQFHASYLFALNIAVAIVCLSVALIIVLRRSDDWMALVAALALLTLGVSFGSSLIQDVFPILWLPLFFLGFFQAFLLILFLLIFPNGHFAPRWTRPFIVIWLAINLPRVWVGSPLDLATYPVLDALSWISALLVGLGSQVWRYRRVSGPVQRQQTKWLVFGILVNFLLILPLISVQLVTGQPTSQPGSVQFLVERTLNGSFSLILPLTVALAALRYRLFDIDLLIRRTLIYAVLTALLLLVYFGSVILLQQLFRAITGAGNDLAIILSTLAIAALFNPLRVRVQRLIDRRFYRQKYDAQAVLAAFAATARDEVDLARLAEQLLVVVEETVEPEHASLWLAQDK